MTKGYLNVIEVVSKEVKKEDALIAAFMASSSNKTTLSVKDTLEGMVEVRYRGIQVSNIDSFTISNETGKFIIVELKIFGGEIVRCLTSKTFYDVKELISSGGDMYTTRHDLETILVDAMSEIQLRELELLSSGLIPKYKELEKIMNTEETLLDNSFKPFWNLVKLQLKTTLEIVNKNRDKSYAAEFLKTLHDDIACILKAYLEAKMMFIADFDGDYDWLSEAMESILRITREVKDEFRVV